MESIPFTGQKVVNNMGAMFEILKFFSTNEIMQLQLLCRKMYHHFIPMFLHYMKLDYSENEIWFSKSLIMYKLSSSIFSGDSLEKERSKEYVPSNYKQLGLIEYTRDFIRVIRVANDLVIILGGQVTPPSGRNYDSNEVYQLNIVTNMIKPLKSN